MKFPALELIGFVAQGWNSRKMAAHYGTSEQTVKNKMRAVYDRLGITEEGGMNQRVLLARWYWLNHEKKNECSECSPLL